MTTISEHRAWVGLPKCTSVDHSKREARGAGVAFLKTANAGLRYPDAGEHLKLVSGPQPKRAVLERRSVKGPVPPSRFCSTREPARRDNGVMHERASLCHLPTPLSKIDALGKLLGTELWVKRDDCTGGPEAGNKLRKLEFLCGDALRAGCDTLITCGAVQSNHARATALTAARLGLDCVLILRMEAGESSSAEGNLLLDRLTGATVHFVDRSAYADRDQLMADEALDLSRIGRKAYVIPEGGSNALGALGYVEAMKEVKAQLPKDIEDEPPFDAIVVACGSGGTAAGCAVGAHIAGLARRVLAMAVCDDRAYFEPRIDAIIAELQVMLGKPASSVPVEVLDHAKGPRYGKCSQEQLEFLALVAKSSGLVLDPVYTAKALFGLRERATSLGRVLFVHTGGLPGLLVQAHAFAGLF